MMEIKNLQITSTNLIPLNSPSNFVIRTIIIHVISSGRRPSWNITCVLLTRVYHLCVIQSFSRIVSISHDFRCSTRIPDCPPACTMWRPLTNTTIYSHRDGKPGISYGCTIIGIVFRSEGCCIQRSSLLVEVISSPSCVEGSGCYLVCQNQHWIVPQTSSV